MQPKHKNIEAVSAECGDGFNVAIPHPARNLEFGPAQKPRDSMIVNGFIFLIIDMP
jgi:hypothetical protein